VTVLALGLGIGINCALFTVVNSLLLRPLPYQNAAELVEITLPERRPALEDLRRARSFAGVAGFISRGFSVTTPEGVRNIYGIRVSANLFELLGVQAAAGRRFSPEEDQQPVVMLSYDYWRRISGDTKIVGRTLTLSGEKHTIVGILPAGFTLQVRDANLFIPYRLTEGRVVARLSLGVSLAQAHAEVAALLRGMESQPARANRPPGTLVIPLSQAFRNSEVRTVLLLQATAGLVLLITCANLANLSLVRAAARRKEFAVRAALGARPSQLLHQLMIESALLAAMGGLLGLLLAKWSLDFLQANLPANIGRTLRGVEALSIDHRVLAFTAGISVLTLLLFGLLPAISSLRFDVMPVLRDSSRSSTPRQRFGQLLVIAEVGLALMLLIGAGLTLKSLVGLQNADLGFSADHILRGAVDLLPSRYPQPEQRVAVFAEIVRRCRALPGVETVGVLAPQFFPFGGPRVRGSLFEIQGRPELQARAEVYVANPDYFRSVRIPLLKGRMFTGADTDASTPVALISEIVARRYWGQEDPVGRLIRLQAESPDSSWVTIVGVVGNVRNPVALDVQPTAYRPFAQTPSTGAILMIRTAGDPMALVETVRKELRAIDPTAPEMRAAGLERAVWSYVSPQRFTTSLLGFFAGLGLLLAAVGVYGVMRYWVGARMSEIGIRIALGAQRKDVLWLVFGRAGRAALMGVVLGIAGALALQRVIASQLYGVSPTDPAVFVAISALMGLVALGAALLPALWAARVDPLVVLRHE
jgi:putative ABC transport system permease protein